MKKLGKVFILGDSYSTFEGAVPSNCLSYYRPDIETDVDTVEKTWWHQLISETDSELLLNTSYSGSTISLSGYEGDYYYGAAFTSRMDTYISSRFFINNPVDTIIIFGGTNDSWIDAPIGNLKYSDWTEDDLKCIFPAFCYLVDKAKKAVDNIIVIINSDFKQENTDLFIEACKNYGVKCVALEDIDKIEGHPTELGMKQISEQVAKHL